MTSKKLENSIDELEREMIRVFDMAELIKESLMNLKQGAGELTATMNHVSLINNLNMIFDDKKFELYEDDVR